MNHSPFWPLVWKEYRAGRAFWLSMAGLGLLAQTTAFWLTGRPADRDWWLYGLALMVSTGFAAGIGGTLFAIEHEDRTFGLLRMLPMRPGELGRAKLLTAALGVVSLVGALWLTASVLAGWKPLPLYDARQLWGLWGLACAEGLGWGILCSLVIRSPLRATIVTLLAVSLINELCVTLTQTHNLALIASYVEAIPLRLAALALVLTADAWLLPRWLAGKSLGSPWQDSPRGAVAPTAGRAQAPSWRQSRQIVWHLVWQSWREGRVHVVWMLVAALIGMGLFREIYWAMLSVHGPVDSDTVISQVIEFLPAALLCALVGVLAFHADQVHSPRFLAERGVPPRLVWLGRQLAWGGWLLVWAAVLAVLPLVLAQVQITEGTGPFLDDWWRYRPLGDRFFRAYEHQQMAESWQYWRVLFCAYAAGQFASLSVRRTVLAVVLAAGLGPLVAAWSWLMFSAGISSWWSMLPVPLAMLWATWLRAPDWLLSRPGRRHWIVPLAVVAVPVALLAVEVPRARVQQIPQLLPDKVEALAPLVARPSPEETAQAEGTYDLYERAAGFYGEASAEEIDADSGGRRIKSPDAPWLKSLVEAVIEAAGRPYNLAALPLERRADLTQRWWFLDKLLLDDAALLESTAQLDRALEIHLTLLRRETQLEPCRDIDWQPGRHPDAPYARSLAALCGWAAAEGQTPERIRAAIGKLEKWHAGLPPAALRLAWSYDVARESIAGEESRYTFRTEEGELTRRFASERARALRLLDQIAAQQIWLTLHMESKIAQNDDAFRYLPEFVLNQPVMSDWLRTTPLVERRIAEFSLAWYVLARETSYRATLIVLALEAWKAEHGQLPGTLDELVGAGLEQVPLDPVYALPFIYYPTGIPALPRPVVSSISSADPRHDSSSLAQRWTYADFMNGKPFIWSALNQASYEISVQRAAYGDEGMGYYRAFEPGDDGKHRLAIEILEAGHAFEIP